MRRGELAEVAREPLLALVVNADIAEDERLVLVQRRPQRGHLIRVQVKIGARPDDLGADARGELTEVQSGDAVRSNHCAFLSPACCRDVLWDTGS